MIKIIYVISVILLFTLSFINKKKEEKIDFITTFFIGIILFTCYNIIVSFALKIISIPVTLLPLSIINYIISTYLLYKIIKNKQIQKYFIVKKDIVVLIIITIIGLIVAYINFGFPFNISYVQVDASNHYAMATSFYKNGDINLGGSMPGAYINYGIIFKVFFNLFGTFDGYKLFIICEIIKLLLSGILFYLAIKNISKGKISYIIAIILSIIYMVGYPLNGMLCGFVYLQMAVNIVNAILIIMINYKGIDNKRKNILLFILLFGLAFTYFILVPPIYVATFLYEFKENRKDIKKFIKNVLSIFALPCIMVSIYYLAPKIPQFNTNSNTYSTPIKSMNSQIAYTAYSFVSYYAMFIFFIPFNIYYVIYKIKKKKIDALSIILVVCALYIIATLILKELGFVVRYYCMKTYYMLWLISLVVTGRIILQLLNSNTKKVYKALVSVAFFVYVIGLIYTTMKGPVSIKIFDNEKETIKSMYNIFPLNRGIMTGESFEKIYVHEELELLKEVTKEFDENTRVIYFEDGLNKEWLKRLINVPEYLTIYDFKEENVVDEYLVNTDKKIYVICYRNTFITYHLGETIDELDEKLNIVAEKKKLIIYTNK